MTSPIPIVGSTTGPFVNSADCPAATNDVTGAGLQTGYQSMMDNAAFLNADKLSKSLSGSVLSGVTHTYLAGSGIQINASANINVDGLINVPSGGGITAADGSVTKIKGRTVAAARVVLSDANHTIGVVGSGVDLGTDFELSGAPAAPRTITWKISSPNAPNTNETIRLFIPNLTSSAQPAYTIQRSDATVVCTINGSISPGTTSVWIELEYTTVVRLRGSSGNALDTLSVLYGVLPGAGA